MMHTGYTEMFKRTHILYITKGANNVPKKNHCYCSTHCRLPFAMILLPWWTRQIIHREDLVVSIRIRNWLKKRLSVIAHVLSGSIVKHISSHGKTVEQRRIHQDRSPATHLSPEDIIAITVRNSSRH